MPAKNMNESKSGKESRWEDLEWELRTQLNVYRQEVNNGTDKHDISYVEQIIQTVFEAVLEKSKELKRVSPEWRSQDCVLREDFEKLLRGEGE